MCGRRGKKIHDFKKRGSFKRERESLGFEAEERRGGADPGKCSSHKEGMEGKRQCPLENPRIVEGRPSEKNRGGGEPPHFEGRHQRGKVYSEKRR